jgi:hypothetical protein
MEAKINSACVQSNNCFKIKIFLADLLSLPINFLACDKLKTYYFFTLDNGIFKALMRANNAKSSSSNLKNYLLGIFKSKYPK